MSAGRAGLGLVLVLLACEGPRSSVGAGGEPAELPRDSGDLPVDTDGGRAESHIVGVGFSGTLVTVVGDGFGRTEGELQGARIDGSFAYNAAVTDSEEDPDRYEARGAGVALSATFAGVTVEGSGEAVISMTQTDDPGEFVYDCFYFADGPQLGEEERRHISIDGVESEVATVWIALCGPSDSVPDDSIPTIFPWTDPSDPHTVSFEDGDCTALAQFDSITPE